MHCPAEWVRLVVDDGELALCGEARQTTFAAWSDLESHVDSKLYHALFTTVSFWACKVSPSGVVDVATSVQLALGRTHKSKQSQPDLLPLPNLVNSLHSHGHFQRDTLLSARPRAVLKLPKQVRGRVSTAPSLRFSRPPPPPPLAGRTPFNSSRVRASWRGAGWAQAAATAQAPG